MQRQNHLVEESTLAVGSRTWLTLGADSLIIADSRATESKANYLIAFYYILWAEISQSNIVISYANRLSKDNVRVKFINFTVEQGSETRTVAWVSKLLESAYRSSQRNKRIKVLINPHSGARCAEKRYLKDIEPIFAAARCEMDVEQTKYKGHATRIAEELDISAFDVIACCSGDGLPHEVFNGLGRKSNAIEALSDVAVVQLPCGTGNGMSWSLNGTGSPSISALCTVKGFRTPLDLASITQGDRRTLSFLSQAFGIVAETDLGTENLRWMGSARFTYGFLVRLLLKTTYPCDLALKVEVADKPSIKEHYQKQLGKAMPTNSQKATTPLSSGLPTLRYGSVKDQLPVGWEMVRYDNLGSFYTGNMSYMAADTLVFPAALPNDGCFDLVTIEGNMSRISLVKGLLAVERGTVFDTPCVSMRKISGYRLIPKGSKGGYISVDGEMLPLEPFQVEVHEGLGTVLSKRGYAYQVKDAD